MMSKSDKTVSTSAFERQHQVDHWWESPEANSRFAIYGMPSKGLYIPPTRRGESKAKKSLSRTYWGGERNRVRMALRKGEQPEPSRTRHSVHWNLY